jgi:hypothetical protein
VIALGELAEHPRPCLVLANLVGTAAEDVRIGMPITIGYQEIPGEDITMWAGWLGPEQGPRSVRKNIGPNGPGYLILAPAKP